jgi:hypothetical protein
VFLCERSRKQSKQKVLKVEILEAVEFNKERPTKEVQKQTNVG